MLTVSAFSNVRILVEDLNRTGVIGYEDGRVLTVCVLSDLPLVTALKGGGLNKDDYIVKKMEVQLNQL